MQLLFGLAGAGIGGALGNAGLGWAIGTLLGGYLFGEEVTQDGARMADQRIQGATQGSPIPIIYGRERVAGNIIWCTSIFESEGASTSSGKKGAGVSSTTFVDSTNIANLICRGNPEGRDDATLRRIWSDQEVVFSHRIELGEVTPVLSEKFNGSDYEFYPGSETQDPDPTIQADKGVDSTPAYLGRCYIVHSNLILNGWGGRIPNFTYEIDTGEWTLEDVVIDILGMVGIEASDVDVSNLASIIVRGFVIPARVEARQALETLQEMYQFDLAEFDGQIKAVIRGGSPEYTIGYDSLGAIESDGDPKPRYRITRVQEVELPANFTVNYHSEANDFQQFAQRAQQLVGFSAEGETLTFQALMTDGEARNLAEIKLHVRWAERDTVFCDVPYTFLKSAPGDVLTLELDAAGTPLEAKIERMEIAAPGIVRLQLRSHDAAAYVQDAAAAAVSSTAGNVIVPSDSGMVVVDANAPADQFADDMWVILAAGRPGSWGGGRIGAAGYPDWYFRTPGGGTLADAAITQKCCFGSTTNAIGDSEGLIIDTDGEITVEIESGGSQLVTITDDEFELGMNLAYVGGEWLNFRDVEDLGSGTYRLTHFKRGLRGTESFMNGHVDEETFLLFNGRCLLLAVHPTLKDSVVQFELYDSNTGPTKTVQLLVNCTIEARSRWPYSPTGLEGERDGGSNDVELTWIRRVRKLGEEADLYEAPLDEDEEVYTLEIWHPSTATILRTETVSGTSAFTYTSAMQTTDLGAPGAFRFRVAQYTPVFSIGNGYWADLVSIT